MFTGGPQAYWATYLISSVFILITAAVLAEICSSLPAAGSIYFWAAESGGPKYGRLLGFTVAWWSTTAWTSFLAVNSVAPANYILSQIAVFKLDFTLDISDIHFRVVQWIVSEIFLVIAMMVNYLPPRWYKYVFRGATCLVMLDFILNVIWLPIAVSQSYGFQRAEFFTEYINMSGGPVVYVWMLGFFATAGVQIGFDASGHVAEETKNASLVAARGLFWSAVASVGVGIVCVFLFLVCAPDLDILFASKAPNIFVPYYALALGNDGQIFMVTIVILATLASTAVSAVAASRLVFAIARDGVLPFSSWIGKVSPNGQPKNALTVIGCAAALLICTVLPSSVAFQSLVSCAGVPTVSAWGLISFARCFITPHALKNSRFSLGRYSRSMQLIAFVWNTYLAIILFSPLQYPVTSTNFNYAPVVMGIITIFALTCWVVFPESAWLQSRGIRNVIESGS